jgi:hypothetical protein
MQPPSPKKFIPAGFVVWAQFYPGEPQFTKNKKASGARANGIRYEKKVQEYLRKQVEGGGGCCGNCKTPWPKDSSSPPCDDSFCTFPYREGGQLELIPSPWLVFKSGDRNSRDRFCQPDSLLVDTERKHITIVEIKLQHTSAAWWQIRQLYEPVLRRIYTNYTFSAMEIVKWLDPQTPFPETFFYAESVFDQNSEAKFGVHIFDPRGRW